MSKYQPIPSEIDWALLINLLRNTYQFGDGGLPADSGIYPHVLSNNARHGVKSAKNAITLWNLAIERLSENDIGRCDISEPQRVAC